LFFPLRGKNKATRLAGGIAIVRNMFRMRSAQRDTLFLKKAYHDEPARLAQFPAGQMMFRRAHVTTNRPVFIIHPAGTCPGLD
jgi:hypothetical protein